MGAGVRKRSSPHPPIMNLPPNRALRNIILSLRSEPLCDFSGKKKDRKEESLAAEGRCVCAPERPLRHGNHRLYTQYSTSEFHSEAGAGGPSNLGTLTLLLSLLYSKLFILNNLPANRQGHLYSAVSHFAPVSCSTCFSHNSFSRLQPAFPLSHNMSS